jgi:twitching motility two-component system response regulator PilG
MARYLNRDILTVARAIYPYVQQGLVQLSHWPSQPGSSAQPQASGSNAAAQPLRVMCIDDDVTVGKIVESMLSERGYRVSAINNPLKSFGVAFKRKPHLILCDIAMPEPDGYEICAMLRRSTAFRQVPIVMLTGKDGFIDRVKARMVGATDYLTKPFGEQELLMLVEKYIGASQSTPSNSEPSTPNSKPDSKKK